jgi:tetratricopeptide (TPR) repeat protein
MSATREFSLEPVRTDGWFERIGDGIASFQALCDILGEKFFAFAMIGGARITALTVDRRVPDNTLVDFIVGAEEDEVSQASAQRVTLAEFRRRLVAALVQEEPVAPPPENTGDIEALQQHIGIRYLLLAPLFGYTLERLRVDAQGSRLELVREGVEESFQLPAFRARLRTHVREELDRVSRGKNRGAIDLGRVAEADQAAAAGEPLRVLELLGGWPAPLAVFLRTVEGQMLGAEARSTIARGLSLLGSACIDLGDLAKGEEILRLAIQYALDGEAAPDVYRRLGEALLADQRAAEAIGPLRRAAHLGAAPAKILPPLARALLARHRRLAALGAISQARQAGVDGALLAPLEARLAEELGPPLQLWREAVGEADWAAPGQPSGVLAPNPSERSPGAPRPGASDGH